MHPLMAELGTARGKRYYELLKQILADIGPLMVADFDKFKETSGKVTLCNVGQIALRHGLNFKATCEWLEDARRLPAGTYETKLAGRIKVRDIMAAAREADAARGLE